MPDAEVKAREIKSIASEVAQCQLCGLCESRKNVVPGAGDSGAKLVIVGEGPGAMEDESGLPFVGRSGRLLDKIIAANGTLKRPEIFITNVVKCRPPGNRTPLPVEIETCKHYLIRQLNAIRPAVVLCMGSTATQALTGLQDPLGKLRGRNLSMMKLALVATYHPSYGLRMGEPIVKLMENDFGLAATLAQEV